MDLGLKGKAALVTGAARGIGKAEALALAAEGCSIAINDIDWEAAEATAAELTAAGTKAVVAIGDVSEEAGATGPQDRAPRTDGPAVDNRADRARDPDRAGRSGLPAHSRLAN